MIKSFITFFNTGHQRSILAKKNILALVFIRGFSILINLILVPLVINYVNTTNYGIWLTLSSIIAWFSFFDIGLNNGLRNKFAEAKANNDMYLAQRYVSTTYGLLFMIFIPLFLLFIIANQWLNWNKILNTTVESNADFRLIALIVVGYFCLKFIISTINIILLADQKPAGSALRQLIEQIFTLFIIIILEKLTSGSLLNLSLALCLAPISVLLLFNITLFKGRYKSVRPKISLIDFPLSKGLFNLGFRFFIIQIAGLIQFQTANFIILQKFGAEDVTSYNIAFKYFWVLAMLMGIIIAPLWSAVTDAYTAKDNGWIIKACKKYLYAAFFLVLLGLFMLAAADKMYDLWLGSKRVQISFYLSFWMYILALLNIFEQIFVGTLNGIGALKLQFISSLFSPILFIVLVFLFINLFNWGVISVVVASVLANYKAFLLAPLQFYKIFKQNKKNFWIT